MPVTKPIRIAIKDCWLTSIYVVDVVSMTVAIMIMPMMLVMAKVMGMRLASIVATMDVRMIPSLMVMMDHGTKRNLHLMS